MDNLMSLLLYLDVETTDKVPYTAGITQLSAIIVRDGKEVSTIDLDINPFSYSRAITTSPKAFEVTGKTVSGVKRYPSASVGFFKFSTWLNAHRDIGEYYSLICYNTKFDLACVESLFKDQTGSSRKLYEYVHFKTLDVMELVKFSSLWGMHKLKNEKLSTTCEHYSIPLQAHDALEDIRATRKLHKKLMANLGLPLNIRGKV